MERAPLQPTISAAVFRDSEDDALLKESPSIIRIVSPAPRGMRYLPDLALLNPNSTEFCLSLRSGCCKSRDCKGPIFENGESVMTTIFGFWIFSLDERALYSVHFCRV